MSFVSNLTIVDHSVAALPTWFGDFISHAFIDSEHKEHLVLVKGDIAQNALCRVHSECLTGNVFFSKKCDCADQLMLGLEAICKEKRGIFMYLRQEGRGIGLVEKIKAYALQQQGYDTFDANIELGHKPDSRDYYIAFLILQNLGVKSIRLLSNNPEKECQLSAFGIHIVKRIPLMTRDVNDENRHYLQVKAEKFKHDINDSVLD